MRDFSKELTVVLTLFDRPDFTFRWFQYAEKNTFPFKVLVADGGRNQEVENVLSEKTCFQKVNYEYLRFPYDINYSQYYAKLVGVLSQVKTPYVVLADDDDFFISDSLVNSVKFMSENPSYISARGRVDAFEILNSTKAVYGKDVKFIKRRFCPSIEGVTASDRLSQHLLSYDITHYDIHRSSDLLSYYKILKDLDLKDVFLAELLTSCLAVICGNVKRSDFFYLFRQSNQPDSCSTKDQALKGGRFYRMLSQGWAVDFEKFTDTLALFLSKQDLIDVEEAKNIIKKNYYHHIAPFVVDELGIYSKVHAYSQRPLLGKVIRFLEKNGRLKKLVKKIVNNARRSLGPSKNYIDKTLLSHSHVYPIYSHLTSKD